MKQFFTLALIAGALMLSAPSQARMVATKAQCVAACDGNGTSGETCNWVVLAYPPRQQGRKYNLCRNKLIRRCRKQGTAAMCPSPPPTTTTQPPVVTTTLPSTTTTSVPPTTTTSTTLPYVDPLGQFEGTSWDFVYTLVSTWTNSYDLGYSYTYTSSGDPLLLGTDEYGGPVGLGQVNEPAIPYDFLLVDPGSVICEAFFFNITSPTTVAGEYFMFYSDCATLVGSPDPFIGYLQ